MLSYCRPSLHDAFHSSLLSNNAEGVRNVLDQVDWTDEASTMIESVLNTKFSAICLDSKVGMTHKYYLAIQITYIYITKSIQRGRALKSGNTTVC